MFKNLLGAVERIQYQQASPLFKSLTLLFQEAIDAIAVDAGSIVLHQDVHQQHICRTLIGINIHTKLHKLIQQHLNHTISGFNIVVTPYVFAAIADGFKVGENSTFFRNDEDYSAGTYGSIGKNYQKLITVLTTQTDTVSGKLRTAVGKYYSSTLFLSTGLFAINRLSPTIKDATAEEIAAILLHELGHSLTHLDALCTVVDQTQHLNTIVTGLKHQLTKDNVQELQLAIAHECGRVVDPLTKARLLLVCNRIQAASTLSKDQAWSIYLTTILALTFAGSFYANDVLSTDLDKSYFERTTDEFAAQHGAGAALASMFVKIETQFESEKRHSLQALMYKGGLLRAAVDKYIFVHTVWSFIDVIANKDYDTPVRRLKLLVQSTAQELSNQNVPTILRDELIETVRAGRVIITEYESRDYVKAREWFWGTLLRISRPGTTLDAIANGNLAADYQRLQELTKDLIQSPFAYHTARLRTLTEKTRT